MDQHRGFTLIELSVVLVIIGLIIGGVLVGRDLINAAAIRAQVSQFEKFDAAVNTFRSKYNALPGDIAAANASAFGMAARGPIAGDLGPGHGDGDGVLESCTGTSANTITVLGCETALFWNDLSFANLIEGSFSADVDSPAGAGTITIVAGHQSSYLPDAKIGAGNSVAVFSLNGSEWQKPAACGQGNFCYGVIKVSQVVAGSYLGQAGMSPIQAFAIDSKMDDGVPNSGKVQGSNDSNIAGFTIPLNTGGLFGGNGTVTGTCLANPSGDGLTFTYNTSDPINVNQAVCILDSVHR